MASKERRDLERAILEQKMINREIEAEGGEKKPEVFVTGAYARELEKRKEFERKMLEKDKMDTEGFENNSGAVFGLAMQSKGVEAGRGGSTKAEEKINRSRSVSPKSRGGSRVGSPRSGPSGPIAGAAPPPNKNRGLVEPDLAPGLSGGVSTASVGPEGKQP